MSKEYDDTEILAVVPATATKLDKIEELLKVAYSLLDDMTVSNQENNIKAMSIKDVAFLMKRFQDLDGLSKDIKAQFYKLFDFIRIGVLPDKMESEGYEGGLKITGLGRISLTSDVHASIPAENKNDAYLWLSDHGHDLVTETVNASSLKALAKRLMRDGEPLPEELFKITPFTRASITKS